MTPLYEHFMDHATADGLRGLLHIGVLIFAVVTRVRLFRVMRELRDLRERERGGK